MSSYYFDSSALVKGYVAESGSDWVSDILMASSAHTIYTARVSGAEVVAGIFSATRAGLIPSDLAETIATHFKGDFRRNYRIMEVSEPIIDSAMILAQKHGLSGYQSVQLATALTLQFTMAFMSLPIITFVSADEKLNAAAATERLAVENPNDHEPSNQ